MPGLTKTPLPKSSAALAAHDKAYLLLEKELFAADTNEKAERVLAEMEKIGREVAEAFAEDTKSINNRDTVVSCVRPNPPPDAMYPGRENWLRARVNEWRQNNEG